MFCSFFEITPTLVVGLAVTVSFSNLALETIGGKSINAMIIPNVCKSGV